MVKEENSGINECWLVIIKLIKNLLQIVSNKLTNSEGQ